MSIVRYFVSAIKRLHPYGTVLFIVVAAGLLVFAVESMLNFPPFLAFAAAVAVCFVTLGVRPGLLALILSALASDFFFIEPRWTFTRYSVQFGMYYLAAAVAFWFFSRKLLHKRDHA